MDREWRASARQKLGERFEWLVKRNDELISLEEGQRDRECGLVLKAWAEDENSRSGWGLEERVQVLDECVTGLWGMSEPGSRFGRVVRRFEKWMDRVVDIKSAREKGVLLDDESGELRLIEELDQQWRDELRSQARKVETFRERLLDLGKVDGNSSLARTLSGLRSMANGMATELEVMKKTEAEVMRAESGWIREMIEDVSSEDEAPTAGAVWRRM